MTSGLLYNNELKLSLIVHGAQRRLTGILITLGSMKVKSNHLLQRLAEGLCVFYKVGPLIAKFPSYALQIR